MVTFKNLWTSGKSGALPEIISLTLPPRAAFVLLKKRGSYILWVYPPFVVTLLSFLLKPWSRAVFVIPVNSENFFLITS